MVYFANVTNLDKARFPFFPLGAVEECFHGTTLSFFILFFLFTSAHFVSGYNSSPTMPPYTSYFIFSVFANFGERLIQLSGCL